MIRIVCLETDSATASNVGGPAITTYKTFDVNIQALEEWLAASDKWKYTDRKVVGVEVLGERSADD